MQDERYDLVFSGQIVSGQDLAQVKKNMQALFRIDAAKVDVLFSGKSVVLKKSVPSDAANKYRVAMKKAGALVNLVLVAGGDSSSQQATAPQSVSPPKTETKRPPLSETLAKNSASAPSKDSGFSTSLGAQATAAPEPRKEIQAPSFSVAAAGTDILNPEEREVVATVVVDISALSVAEQSGNLVDEAELERPIPAVVQDLQAELAPVGSDVLKPDERKTVTPVSVDTSQFSVGAPGERLSTRAPDAPPPPNVDHISLTK